MANQTISDFLSFSRISANQARRQDCVAGRSKIKRGATQFQYSIDCLQQPPRKKSLTICKHNSLCNSTQKVIQIRTPKRPSTVICSFATLAWEETRNSLFCNRYNCYFLVGCPRVSPLPLASNLSLELQHIKRFPVQQK